MTTIETAIRATLNFALSPIYGAILLRHEIEFGLHTGYTIKEWF
jgi:hypothetical protein